MAESHGLCWPAGSSLKHKASHEGKEARREATKIAHTPAQDLRCVQRVRAHVYEEYAAFERGE